MSARRTLVRLGAVLMCALVGGCATASSNLTAKLPDGTAYGRAVFYAVSTIWSCTNMVVHFSQPDGNRGYKPLKSVGIIYSLVGRTSIAHLDVPPGRYFVAGATCMTSDYLSFDFMPRNDAVVPLASFDVGAGEVVDIGSLLFFALPVKTGGKGSVVIVENLSAKKLADFRSSNPTLAAKLVTRHARSSVTVAHLDTLENGLSSPSGGLEDSRLKKVLINAIRRARVAMPR